MNRKDTPPLLQTRNACFLPMLKRQGTPQAVWVELRGESKVGPLVSLIVRSGGEVEEVRKGKASLEDVFLALMEEENT